MTLEELQSAVSLEDKIITIRDARACYKGCIPGWQVFCERHGYEWKTVIRNGLKASELLATNDVMAETLVRSVYE